MHEAFTGIRVVKATIGRDGRAPIYGSAEEIREPEYAHPEGVGDSGPLIDSWARWAWPWFLFSLPPSQADPGDMLQFVASLFMMYNRSSR